METSNLLNQNINVDLFLQFTLTNDKIRGTMRQLLSSAENKSLDLIVMVSRVTQKIGFNDQLKIFNLKPDTRLKSIR